jgi:hypothetical protein
MPLTNPLAMPRLTPAQLEALARDAESDLLGFPTPRGWAKVGEIASRMNFTSAKTQQDRA